MGIVKKNVVIQGKHHNKPILLDYHYNTESPQFTPVIFVHGFKGFKDWGPFDFIAQSFAQMGFCFVKLNLSHNGTTPEAPNDFHDLEAFAQNNFSIELNDIGDVIDHLHTSEFALNGQLRFKDLSIIGHSRGGGLAILKAREDARIQKLSTWAAMTDIKGRWPQPVLDQWKKDGVIFVPNSRTNQQMPLYYQIVEDYLKNEDRLNVVEAIKTIGIPFLAFHGTEDETLPVALAKIITEHNRKAELDIIENANHTFGGAHPFVAPLPEALSYVVQKTKLFLSPESK